LIREDSDKKERRDGATMARKTNLGYAIAVVGGIGLGLLLGSEFAGTYTTLLGAALTIIAVATIAISRKGN
jgi:hypothetical protein